MDKWLIQQSIDLEDGLLSLYSPNPQWPQFVHGDNKAHVWEITVTSGGSPAEISTHTSTAYFNRSDANAVMVQGTITDNVVTFVLPQECYAIPGSVTGFARITNGSESDVTIAVINFNVKKGPNGAIIDPGEVIPTLDELLALVGKTENLLITISGITFYIDANGNLQMEIPGRDTIEIGHVQGPEGPQGWIGPQGPKGDPGQGKSVEIGVNKYDANAQGVIKLPNFYDQFESKIAIELKEGDDLNNFVALGKYVARNATVARLVLNAPSNEQSWSNGFFMQVIPMRDNDPDNSTCMQILYTDLSPNIYYRVYTYMAFASIGPVWTQWNSVASLQDVRIMQSNFGVVDRYSFSSIAYSAGSGGVNPGTLTRHGLYGYTCIQNYSGNSFCLTSVKIPGTATEAISNAEKFVFNYKIDTDCNLLLTNNSAGWASSDGSVGTIYRKTISASAKWQEEVIDLTDPIYSDFFADSRKNRTGIYILLVIGYGSLRPPAGQYITKAFAEKFIENTDIETYPNTIVRAMSAGIANNSQMLGGLLAEQYKKTKPEEIPAGSDLNNYTTIGDFVCLTSSNSDKVNNKPVNTAGWAPGFGLSVVMARQANGIDVDTDFARIQFFYRVITGGDYSIWTRGYYSQTNTWTNWNTLFTSAGGTVSGNVSVGGTLTINKPTNYNQIMINDPEGVPGIISVGGSTIALVARDKVDGPNNRSGLILSSPAVSDDRTSLRANKVINGATEYFSVHHDRNFRYGRASVALPALAVNETATFVINFGFTFPNATNVIVNPLDNTSLSLAVGSTRYTDKFDLIVRNVSNVATTSSTLYVAWSAKFV